MLDVLFKDSIFSHFLVVVHLVGKSVVMLRENLFEGHGHINLFVFVIKILEFLLLANNIEFLFPLVLFVVLKLKNLLSKVFLDRFLELYQLFLIISLLYNVFDVVLKFLILLKALV